VIYTTQARTDIQFRWIMFASVFYVLSFVVGLRWGIMGVAVSYAIVWTLLMVPSFLIPFHFVKLSGLTFLHTLWPTIWMGLVMASCAGAWRYGLRRWGIINPFVDLFSTVLIGAAVYVGLVLWRKPPVLSELAIVLEGTSYRATRWIGQHLPRATGGYGQTKEFEPLNSSQP
jgi:hypothetical protein